jgi:hypothetical protein
VAPEKQKSSLDGVDYIMVSGAECSAPMILPSCRFHNGPGENSCFPIREEYAQAYVKATCLQPEELCLANPESPIPIVEQTDDMKVQEAGDKQTRTDQREKLKKAGEKIAAALKASKERAASSSSSKPAAASTGVSSFKNLSITKKETKAMPAKKPTKQ